MSPAFKLRPFPKKRAKGKKANRDNRDILEDSNKLALFKG
jgi:hypothetical protein